MDKDYSLLRPFDLEAAKDGCLLCDSNPEGTTADEPFKLEAVAGPDGGHAVRDACGNLYVSHQDDLRMVPLCWVEGRPVYKGDLLNYTSTFGGRIVEFVVDDFKAGTPYSSSGWMPLDELYWPKQKHEMQKEKLLKKVAKLQKQIDELTAEINAMENTND